MYPQSPEAERSLEGHTGSLSKQESQQVDWKRKRSWGQLGQEGTLGQAGQRAWQRIRQIKRECFLEAVTEDDRKEQRD